MPTKNSTIGIQDFKTLLSGNFHKATAPLDATSIEKLFDKIEDEWADGKPVLRQVREPGGTTTKFHYSILCIPLKPTPPPFLPNTNLRETRYGFVLLMELDGVLAVFKRGASGFDEWVDSCTTPIKRGALTRVFAKGALYEKMSLRRMTVSRRELSGCSYESFDLATTIPGLALSRSIPRYIRLRHPQAGTVSLTPSTARVHKSGGRLDIATLAQDLAPIIAQFSAPHTPGFLDAFPIPEDFYSLPANVEPTAVLFELPSMGESDGGQSWQVVSKTDGKPDENITDRIKKGYAEVLALKKSKTLWKFGGAQLAEGQLEITGGQLHVQLKSKVKEVLVNQDNEEIELKTWLRQNKAFTVSFTSPEWFYTQGQLYRRSDFRRDIDLVYKIVDAHPAVAGLTSEKGNTKKYNKKTRGFDVGSIFRFVEDDLCASDKHLLCCDLNDEWADYISITSGSNGGVIRFLHCKHDSPTVGASSFHDVIGQGLKNLGRAQATPNELVTKIGELEAQQFWTKKVHIPRYRGPGNPTKAAQELIADPFSRKEVVLVVTMLKKKAFEQEMRKTPLEPHFVQLVWLLSGFMHACREMGAKPLIVCQP